MLNSHYTSFVYQAAVKDLVPVSTADNAPPPFTGCPYVSNGSTMGTSNGYTVDAAASPRSTREVDR